MARNIRSERITRSVIINGKVFRFVKTWHYLDNGMKYHFIHVYRNRSGIEGRPIKRFAWLEDSEGNIHPVPERMRRHG